MYSPQDLYDDEENGLSTKQIEEVYKSNNGNLSKNNKKYKALMKKITGPKL